MYLVEFYHEFWGQGKEFLDEEGLNLLKEDGAIINKIKEVEAIV